MRLDSIKVRITFFAGIALLIVMCALIAYSGVNLWTTSVSSDIAEAEALADGYAKGVAAELEVGMDTARTLATTIAGMKLSGRTPDRGVLNAVVETILRENPKFVGMSIGMEPDALDGLDAIFMNTTGHDATGRYVPYFSLQNGKINVVPLEGYTSDDYYLLPKQTGNECIINPYLYNVNGKDVLMTSLMAPIMVKGQFIGVIGVDIALDIFQDSLTEETVFDGHGKLSLVANNGDIAAFGGVPDLVGVNLKKAFSDMPALSDQVGRGESFTIFSEALGEYGIFRPVQVGKSATPWSVIVVLPKQIIVDTAMGAVIAQTLIALILLVLGLAGMWFVASRIARPIILTSRVANIVADSKFQDLSQIPSDKEFYGELLDLHHALGSMVKQALQALGEAGKNAEEAEEKARLAEQAVLEAEEAKRESELATQRGIAEAASRIQGIVERVSSATEELSAQVDQSSQGAETQKDRMTETATAMEEMNATVLEVAQNASEAASNADDARSRASQGADIVGRVVQSITEINQQAGGMKDSLDELGHQAEGIGEIMNVISDIADQTNLLALNAAIEAARAGDAGRGFAVVADEVRKLAEKTMTATREVGEAITSIQAGTRNNISNMDNVASVIEQSTDLAQESGESLSNIVTIAESTADQVRAIATASEQQAATSEEINRGTDEVTRISAETSDIMAQASGALVELAAMTGELAAIVQEMQQH